MNFEFDCRLDWVSEFTSCLFCAVKEDSNVTRYPVSAKPTCGVVSGKIFFAVVVLLRYNDVSYSVDPCDFATCFRNESVS